MRKILLLDAKAGMTLAKSIYSDDGRILLASEITLKEAYLEKLKKLNIPAIYIKDDLLPCIEIPEVISETTRQAATSNVKEFFHQLSTKGIADLKKVTKSVNHIIDELLTNPKVLVNLTDIRSHDNYTFAHCTNVCVLSVLTGITLGLNQLQLKELGVGAILHDIGKITISKNILNKPAKLTDDEFALVKEHSTSGFELTRKIEGISTLSAHVPFQHHEKVDGTGYPRGLKGKEIHLYAKIAAVADVFDALVADRVYRHAFSTHEASEVIAHGANVYFDKTITHAFLKNIAIFPIGSLVRLNTGEIAVVVDVNRELHTRPIVKIISGPDKLAQGKGAELDLCKYPTVLIEKLIKPEDPEYFQI